MTTPVYHLADHGEGSSANLQQIYKYDNLRSYLWSTIIRSLKPQGILAMQPNIYAGFVDDLRKKLERAFGQPAELSQNHLIFESPNMFVELQNTTGWSYSLWIPDRRRSFDLPAEVAADWEDMLEK